MALKVRFFFRVLKGPKKASRFDLESGFPGVGFAPEGSYFGPLALKVRFLRSSGWSPKHKTLSLGPVQRFSGSGTGSGTGSGPGSAVQRFTGSVSEPQSRFSGSAVRPGSENPIRSGSTVPVRRFVSKSGLPVNCGFQQGEVETFCGHLRQIGKSGGH